MNIKYNEEAYVKKGLEFIFLSFEYSVSLKHLLNTKTELNRPDLFLFRHSLELFLKGVDLILGGKSWGHDLENIPLNLSNDIKNMASPFTLKKTIVDIAKVDIGGLQKLNNLILKHNQSKLNDLRLKYNRHTYLKDFEELDKSNLLLRYPINEEFDTLVKSADKDKLKKDFDELFSVTMHFLGTYTDLLL